MNRTRTFDWRDPALVAADARRLSGLDFLRSVAGRGTPQAAPVAQCLGFELTEAERGRVVFELVPAEHHYNPLGGVHGGVLCTLCDSAAGAAVHSMLDAGTGYTTLEVKVSFVRPATVASERLRCEGRVLSLGARVATSEARIVDAKDRLVAHATSTCLVFPIEGAPR